MSAGGALRRADRRHGRGQVDRAGGARAAGGRGDLQRRGGARALRGRASCARRWSSASAPRLRRRGGSTARRSRERAFATPEDRAWLEGLVWPLVGAPVASWLRACARARARRRGRRWWRCRCCSRRACEEVYDATIAVVAEEALRARARAARGHELRRGARRAPAPPAGEGAAGDLRGAQRRHRARISSAQLSEVLEKLRRE